MSKKSSGNMAKKTKVNPQEEQKNSSPAETNANNLASLEEIALKMVREGRMPKNLDEIIDGVLKRAREQRDNIKS